MLTAMLDTKSNFAVKNFLDKITDAIDYCYSSGKGSKRIIYMDFNQNLNLRLYSDGERGIALVNFNSLDNSRGIIDYFDYPNLNENIHLSKGFNKIAVEWNEDSNKIEVKKFI